MNIRAMLLFAAVTGVGCSIDHPAESRHSDIVSKHHHDAAPTPAPIDDQPPQPIVSSAHPRLYFTDADIPAIKLAIQRDPVLDHQFAELRREGEKALIEPPADYVRDTEKALIQSRLVLARVSTLAGLYRLTGEERFAKRAVEEMRAAAAFPDWHSEDFLPDAELINALSVGYDWLYRYLTLEERKVISTAILAKGLKPAEQAYQHNGDWTHTESNHNIVGNGGVAVGAVTLGDEEPKLSRELITATRRSLPTSLGQYEPDGAWPEGPIYWDYATRYATYYMASLGAGNEEVSRSPGLASTGLFRIHSTGPTKKTFNFGDAEEAVHPAPFMYWFAREFNKPIYAAHEEYVSPNDTTIFGLIWRSRLPGVESFESIASKKLPTSAIFRGSELAFMRSDWSANATWVGFKGGTNKGTHRHLDLGSFVLDALGERWALDLGPDDYGLPGYNGSDQRWSYYRCQTEGHNTLTINGPNQEFEGDARLVGFHSDPQRTYAVVDLTNAYTHARSILRGIELLNGNQVLTVDEVTMSSPARITWNFHTPAKVALQGASATLVQNGKSMRLQILEPAGAMFDVASATAPPPQQQNKGVSNLIIKLPSLVEKTRIAVLCTPTEEVDGKDRRAMRAEPGLAATPTMKIDSLHMLIEDGPIRR